MLAYLVWMSLLIGKDSVYMTMAVGDHETWASRDQFRTLLFTLSVETTAHDLGTFLDRAGGKTCVINQSIDSGNHVCCVVVGFESEKKLESAYHTKLIFGGVKLFWARINLVRCENSHFNFGSGSGFPSPGTPTDKDNTLVAQDNSLINNHLALLECSLELLADQVSSILYRLNGVKLVSLVPVSQVMSSVVSAPVLSTSDTDMILDVSQPPLPPSFPVAEKKMVDLGLSSSKILTFKVSGLESKMVALEVSIDSILEKLDLLCVNSGSLLIWKVAMCNVKSMSNLAKQKDINMYKFDGIRIFTTGLDVGFCGARVAVIMKNCLARHVSKVEKIPGCLISVCFLFKNKLSVMILDLYAGVSIGTYFGQAADINSMVSKMVNPSSFVILGGDFNENGSEVDVVKYGIPGFLSEIAGFQELQDSHKELQNSRIPGFLSKELQDSRNPRIPVVKN
ncbi:hypothetical protein G9A89_020036 [Geosiphon pyriformis]|nr:hypothetical protein G9A89_020036 [Geosiphon pyriformis]